MSPSKTAWTTPADVVERLRRRWDRGEFLSAWARDVPFTPVSVPLRGPSTGELSARFDDVRDWVRLWAKLRIDGVHVQERAAGRHTIGANTLPSRLDVQDYDALWRLLGVNAQVRLFAELRASSTPSEIVAWMNGRPLAALAHAGDWPRLVQTANWIAALPTRSAVYLREVPVPGVDTKFIERHKGILGELLDVLLPCQEIDTAFTTSQFERRYGFAAKPIFVRLRALDPARPLVSGITEMSVRAEQLARVVPDVATVYIVENEITYLAFPAVADAVIFFGGGLAVSTVASAPWLQRRRVIYWGDIDTHGFVALDRLRALVPHTESMLMDRRTLLAHAGQWGQEPSPTSAPLPHLTDTERALYHDLVENTCGNRVRLEQERVGYPMIHAAIETHRTR